MLIPSTFTAAVLFLTALVRAESDFQRGLVTPVCSFDLVVGKDRRCSPDYYQISEDASTLLIRPKDSTGNVETFRCLNGSPSPVTSIVVSNPGLSNVSIEGNVVVTYAGGTIIEVLNQGNMPLFFNVLPQVPTGGPSFVAADTGSGIAIGAVFKNNLGADNLTILQTSNGASATTFSLDPDFTSVAVNRRGLFAFIESSYPSTNPVGAVNVTLAYFNGSSFITSVIQIPGCKKIYGLSFTEGSYLVLDTDCGVSEVALLGPDVSGAFTAQLLYTQQTCFGKAQRQTTVYYDASIPKAGPLFALSRCPAGGFIQSVFASEEVGGNTAQLAARTPFPDLPQKGQKWQIGQQVPTIIQEGNQLRSDVAFVYPKEKTCDTITFEFDSVFYQLPL